MSLVNTDVVVVGAGPAGSFAALQAANLGLRVTICEEHEKVGRPSHCTGHMSLAGLKRFNLGLPRKVFENQITSAVFYSPSHYSFSVRFGSPVTCVVNRALFDEHLSSLATEAGANILFSTHARALLSRGRSFTGVVAKRGSRVAELRSKVVIDAEGVSGALLKRAGLPSPHRGAVINGVQAEVDKIRGGDDDVVEVFLGNTFAPGFFAWIVPKRDGTAKVGLGTARGNPRDCLHRFIDHHPIAHQRLCKSSINRLVYHPIPLGGPIRRTFHDGLLVVGDASSHVKPTTGGGVIMGLTCAEIAGTIAALAVQQNDTSAHFLSAYERQWRRRLGFDMRVMKHLRVALSSLSDKQLDQLVGLCSRLELEKSLKTVQDLDFQGASLVHMEKSLRTLTTALYLLIASFL